MNTYQELEQLAEKYRQLCLDSLVSEMAGLIVGSPTSNSDKDYNLEMQFLCDIQQLKARTKMVQIKSDPESREHLEAIFKSVEGWVDGRYIVRRTNQIDTKNKVMRYDRVILYQILLGEDYRYWAPQIEKKYKTGLFKKIEDIDWLIYNILNLTAIAEKEEFYDYAVALINNSKNILSSRKEMTLKYQSKLNAFLATSKNPLLKD